MHVHHDDLLGSHLGQNQTLTTIQHKYWWPHMSAEIVKWAAACEPCQRHKALRQGRTGPYSQFPRPQGHSNAWDWTSWAHFKSRMQGTSGYW